MISLVCGVKKKIKLIEKRSDWWLPEVGDVVWENHMKMVKRHKRSVIRHVNTGDIA